MNEAGQEDGNPDMVAGRTLPWLQDTKETDAWSSWGVVYRDVVIVGPTGEKLGAYNLTEHDLGDAANMAALDAKLRAAADAK